MGERGSLRSIVSATYPPPADLVVATVLALVAVPVVLVPTLHGGLDGALLRVVVGLPLILFFPGYTITAALFPERGEAPDDRTGTDTDEPLFPRRDRGIDGFERLALSFGLSIVTVALVGLALSYTPIGITLVPVTLSLSGIVVLGAGIAARRRLALQPSKRFRVPYRSWVGSIRRELFTHDSRADTALNVVLLVSVLVIISSLTYAVAIPHDEEQFTEFSLLTEDDDGELVAANYPDEVVRGDTAELVVGIENHEHEPIDYTVVVVLQEVGTDDGDPSIEEQHHLATYRAESVEHGDAWYHHHEVLPPVTGENLRLTYLLYEDDPPEDVSVESSYRDLHLWIDVPEPEEHESDNER